MFKNIVVTGASSGFGALTGRRLADAGHIVYAGIRDTDGRNKQAVSDAADYANTHDVGGAALPHLRAQNDGLLVWMGSSSTRGGTPPYLGPYFAAMAADTAVADAYETRYAGLLDQVSSKLAELAPPDADPNQVAQAVVRVVDTPKGKRPFRVHIDPANDGAEEVNALGDRIRATFYQRVGLADLLTPRTA